MHPNSVQLRGSANRRVAYVSRNNGKAVESLLELPSMKSCQPIGGSSKYQRHKKRQSCFFRRIFQQGSIYPESFDLTYKKGVAGSNPASPTTRRSRSLAGFSSCVSPSGSC